MTADERKALSFVTLLLALSVLARVVNRPEPILISGSAAVEINTRLSQNQHVRERLSTPNTAAKAPAPERAPRPVEASSVPELVNVNEATAEELVKLPGVGPALAERIIAYRSARGRLHTLEQLDSVRGIGPVLLAKLRPLVTVR